MKFLHKILLLVFLVLAISAQQAASQIIINEVSQGPAGSQEYVEFLVVGAPCSSSCLDLRLWIFDDNNGYLNGSPTTGVGIAAGACRFANDAFWSCIPSGTHITIYNNVDPNPSVPPDDISMVDGNCSLIIPITSSLFDHHPSEPSSTSSAYVGTGWLAGGNWADISMANGQDGFQIFDPADLVTPVFSIGWGPINTNGDIYMGVGSATDDVFYADNGVDCDFTIQGNWVEGCAGDLGVCGSDDGTPGTANSAGNAACISQFNGNCASTGPLVIDTIIPVNVNCSGGCNATATASVSGGVAPYTFLWNDPSAQTDSVAVSLCAGTFTVTVTDATGCVDTLDSVVISGGLEVTSAITNSTNIPCSGACVGTATVTAASGLPPYTYSWNDPGTQTTALATGLCVGSFEVIVIDANGCDDTSNVVLSGTPSFTSAIAASTNPQCFGACTGTATVTVGGGTSPYTYAWNDPALQSDSTATGLCVGTYIITITDFGGCTDTTLAVISGPTAMSLASGITSATCGATDGQAWVSVTGGNTPYTYLWDDLGAQTTDTAYNIGGGLYQVMVIDALGCSDSIFVTVVDAGAPTVTLLSSTDNACGGDSTGTASIAVTGGATPYTYSWNDPNTQTTTSVTGLPAGSFTAIITDSAGCVTGIVVPITEPSPITIGLSAIGVSCGGPCDGQATVTTTGGVTPYTYVWNDPGTQTNTIATGLCLGIVTVAVIDSNSCLVRDSISINGAGAPVPSISASTNVLCNGDSTGSATVTAIGGQLPYTYQWNDAQAQTGNAATGLAAGAYTVLITDSLGCSSNAIIAITEPTAMLLGTSSQPTNCGVANGAAYVAVTGGSAPYTYLWSDPMAQTNDSAVALIEGSYTVQVTDSLNCSDTVTVNVVNLSGFTIQSTSANNVTCNGMGDGAATVSVSGGSTPYTFLWDAGAGSQTDSIAINLSPGTYAVTITEGGGCVDSVEVTITQPAAIILGVSGANANCGLPDGSVTATIFGGTQPYTYLWDDPLAQTTVQAVNLDSGTYSVSILDSNGCADNGQVTITQSAGGFAEVLNPIVDATCFGTCDGSILVSMNGGTSPFTYLWTDGQTSSAATTLCAGVYEVTVTDVNGCQAVLDSFITEPPQIVLSGSGTSASCDGTCSGTTSIFVSGTNTPYTYLWDTAAGNQTVSVATALCQGDYMVTVTDGNGCTGVDTVLVPMDSLTPIADYISFPDTASLVSSTIDFLNMSLPDLDSLLYQWDFGDGAIDTVVHPTHTYLDTGIFQVQLIVTNSSGCKDTILYTVVIEDDYIVFAPNSFSPNGDGVNDFFFPQGVGIDDHGFTLYIFNRWGDQIFVSTDKLAQWDGRANGGAEVAQEEVYVWMLQTREQGTGKKHTYYGHVTIVR